MRRIWTLGAPALLIFGASSLSLGFWLWCGEGFQKEMAGLKVDAGTKSFGTAPAGGRLLVSFNLTNPTGATIHVLGGARGCFAHGCLDPLGLPLEIPGHGGREVAIEVHASDPGDFSGEVVLYTDFPGSPETLLVVTGLVIGSSRTPSL